MANTNAAGRFIIDTPGAAVLYEGRFKILYVYWYKPTTLNHLAVIKNKDGEEVLTLSCEVANESQVFNCQGEWVDGLIVDTLESGKLYISYE